MILESLTFLIAEPVHEETISPHGPSGSATTIFMAMPNAETRLKNPVMRPMDPANLSGDGQESKNGGNMHFSGEEGHCAAESIASKPTCWLKLWPTSWRRLTSILAEYDQQIAALFAACRLWNLDSFPAPVLGIFS